MAVDLCFASFLKRKNGENLRMCVEYRENGGCVHHPKEDGGEARRHGDYQQLPAMLPSCPSQRTHEERKAQRAQMTGQGSHSTGTEAPIGLTPKPSFPASGGKLAHFSAASL